MSIVDQFKTTTYVLAHGDPGKAFTCWYEAGDFAIGSDYRFSVEEIERAGRRWAKLCRRRQRRARINRRGWA